MHGETKPTSTLATQLHRIATRSAGDSKAEYGHLMALYSQRNLADCFDALDGRKAVGVDGKTKAMYGQELAVNLAGLVHRMKRMGYRPQPVREVLIPKGHGKYRPLGLSVVEDKVVQSLTGKILEAIYEPLFRESSFGFRPGRSAHQAVKTVINSSFKDRISTVIDVDLENFFGSIDHGKLIALLRLKIKDERFLRYIHRMLKAGVLKEGMQQPTHTGTPQGSMASPILANIVGHYAFDTWFEDVVTPRCRGNVKLVRYCDDMVILCEYNDDAERVYRALKGRTRRFGLKLNAEKTMRVQFSQQGFAQGVRQGSFQFLGFTFYQGRSRKGHPIPKVKTSARSFREKLKVLDRWCRKYRSVARLRSLWGQFCNKLRGHISYFSVSHNTARVVDFIQKARQRFFKWINRRSQRRSMSWEKFLLFERQFPPPRVKVMYSLF